MPCDVATFVNERKVKTSHEAAVLADECFDTQYLLRCYWVMMVIDPLPIQNRMRQTWSNLLPGLNVILGINLILTCNYCHQQGHWKKECPALKAQSRSNFGQVKSSALVATVRQSVYAVPGVELSSETVSKKSDYSAFISESDYCTGHRLFRLFHASVNFAFRAVWTGFTLKILLKVLRYKLTFL